MSASGFLGCGPPELAFQIRCGVEERNKTAASGVFFCLSPVPFSLALKAFGVRISGVVATPRKSTTYDRTVGPSYCAIIGFSFVRNSRGQWLEKLDLPSSQGSSKNNFEMFLFDEEKKTPKNGEILSWYPTSNTMKSCVKKKQLTGKERNSIVSFPLIMPCYLPTNRGNSSKSWSLSRTPTDSVIYCLL